MCVQPVQNTSLGNTVPERHNLTLHGDKSGEIVRLLDFVVGRSSGRYQTSHPFWYRRNGKRIHKFGRATVEDYVGDTFPI